jgi:hypothetical protein
MNVVHHASLKGAQRAREANLTSANDGPGDQSLTLYLGDLLAGIKKELTKESKPYVEIKGTEQLNAEPSPFELLRSHWATRRYNELPKSSGKWSNPKLLLITLD